MPRPRWQKIAVAASGIAAAYAVERVTVGRARRRVDRAAVEAFGLPAGATIHHVDVSDGGVVRAVEHGSGPPVVLLHGVTHAAEVWSWQIEDLAATHRVIALDHRGHGQSTPGRDPWSIARLASDVAETLEHLDVRGAVLAGHSLGGIVTQQLLIDHPALTVNTDGKTAGSDRQNQERRIRGVVLLSTTAGGLNLLPAAWETTTKALVGTARRGVSFASRAQDRLLGANDVAWLMFRFGLGSNADATHVELTRRLTAATPLSTLAELMEDVVGLDLRHRLGAITLPAVVVVGTRDLVTPVRDSRAIVERIPSSRLEVLPGAGHMVMFERRDDVSRLLADFAREVGAGEVAA